jgi:hypothetical protein
MTTMYQYVGDGLLKQKVAVTIDPTAIAIQVLTEGVEQAKIAVQTLLDTKAQSKGYDTIISATSYVGFPNAFRNESERFLTWKAGCWTKCYQILGAVQTGTRTLPTLEELLAEMPTFVEA